MTEQATALIRPYRTQLGCGQKQASRRTNVAIGRIMTTRHDKVTRHQVKSHPLALAARSVDALRPPTGTNLDNTSGRARLFLRRITKSQAHQKVVHLVAPMNPIAGRLLHGKTISTVNMDSFGGELAPSHKWPSENAGTFFHRDVRAKYGHLHAHASRNGKHPLRFPVLPLECGGPVLGRTDQAMTGLAKRKSGRRCESSRT